MGFWTALAVSVVSSAATSTVANSRARKTNNAATIAGYRQDLFNANGNSAMTLANNQARASLAGMTAGQILAIGAMNAANVEKARDRNIKLLNFQKVEDNRLHVNEEVRMVGNIRVGYASAGVSTSTGSAKAVKIAEMKKAELGRDYMNEVSKQQILGLWMTETEKAGFIRLEASMSATATAANAAFQNQVAQSEADQIVANAQNNLGSNNGSSAIRSIYS
jgi:hypothetical protein